MDSARWQRVQTLFHQAADLPASEQRGFLETQCGDDPALVSEVLILLREDSRGGSLLERDVGQVAHEVLGDSSSDAAPFKEFGPYRIIQALGEGGMGMVYLAEREDLGSRVAIKVLRDAWLSPARRERFAIEQRTLAQLNHSSIARLYDADTSPDGTPFFVMEYVEGVPLTEYCKQRHSSIAERLRLFRDVCEAVLYAHQHAVIHRDLKPSNILVKDDGTVRLLDFGIAKHLQSLGEAVDQTLTGLRFMTPAYAAPEQIRGEQVGIQSDVYSLGVVLYELLAGRLPFDLSNRTPAQAEKILTEQVAAKPSEIAATTVDGAEGDARGAAAVSKAAWADLDVLCLTAMHKDAQQRYQSVEALIRDIDHYLKGEPLDARPDTLRYRARKFVTRNWRAVSAAAAVIAVVVGLVVFFTLRLARERDNANRQTAIATTINQFLSDDLLGRGNPYQSGKATETLLDAIKVASPRIDRKFKDEPQVAARLHLTIAQALDNRTNYPEARAEYERAYQLFLQTEGPLSQDAIVVQLQRAAMEARSYQSGGLPVAKSLLAEQETLIPQVKNPRKDLPVWLYTAKGMIALIENDAKSANQNFKAASDAAMAVPDFDETARFNLRQRLAFTYIRLGDGATAERLARELIVAYAGANGSDSPYVLRVRLNLAQAFMIEGKYHEAVQEANGIYPDFLEKFGPEHELTMQLLATRAQSEGSLGLYEDSTRDDLAIYKIALQKQGPGSFYAIATLSDASEAQCRSNHLAEGEQNARKAHDGSIKAFGPHAGLTGGTALPLANCLIEQGKLQEASKLLAEIDSKVVAQLTGDPYWEASVNLAQAEIALRERNYAQAHKLIEAARPAFSRPDAEAYEKNKLDALSAEINTHLQ
ncbi:MAG: serine/threonine-protein kinase [Candidatus Acidiferrales bacterium]